MTTMKICHPKMTDNPRLLAMPTEERERELSKVLHETKTHRCYHIASRPDPAFPVLGKSRRFNPGDMLAWAIKEVTGRDASDSCACEKRRRQMNEWGWIGCLKHRATIIGWIADEAAKRGHVIGKARSVSLLLAAYKELRK